MPIKTLRQSKAGTERLVNIDVGSRQRLFASYGAEYRGVLLMAVGTLKSASRNGLAKCWMFAIIAQGGVTARHRLVCI